MFANQEQIDNLGKCIFSLNEADKHLRAFNRKLKVLYISIRKQWFDDIRLGIKKFEYREKKHYWDVRLVDKSYDAILFVNGRKGDSDCFLIEYKGYDIIDGVETPIGSMEQYKIKLGNVIDFDAGDYLKSGNYVD